MIKICVNCGKEYPAAKKASKFCGRACSAENQSKSSRKICEHCGKEYKVHGYRKSTAKFCGEECRRAAQYLPGFDGENKICTECNQLKPLSDFWKGRTKCKSCLKKQNDKRYEENKEQYLEAQKKYRVENHEKITRREKNYRDNNKEQRHLGNKRWKAEHPERVRKLKRIHEQVRRARKAEVIHDLTWEQWEEALLYFNHECAYCGSDDELAQEHVVPVAKGGGYTKNNIIPSCPVCNGSKGDKIFEDWYFDYPHFTNERFKKIIKFIELNTEESLAENCQESVESRGSLKQ